MTPTHQMGRALLIAAVTLALLGCKARRSGPSPNGSSTSSRGSQSGVQPTPKPTRELPSIDDNSSTAPGAGAASMELRSFFRHLTPADPVRLAVRFRDADAGGQAPGAGSGAKQLDLHATLGSLEFLLKDPQGNTKRFKLKDSPAKPLAMGFTPSSQVLELGAAGLSIGPSTLPWATPVKALFNDAGSYELQANGELVTPAGRVKLESGALTFQVATESPSHLSLSALQAIAGKLVAERQELSAPPIARAEAVEDVDGNRSFRYQLDTGGYDDTVIEVTLSSAGKEVFYDVYTHFSCVAQGTPIATPSGPTPVERLRIGSEVTAYDVRSGRRTTAHVVAVRSAHAERLVELGSLRVTGSHPVFADGQWTHASDLTVGAQLLSSDLKPLSVVPTPLTQPSTVYDLSVTEPHTYFAGGLLLHNKAVYVPIGGAQPWDGHFYRRAAKR